MKVRDILVFYLAFGIIIGLYAAANSPNPTVRYWASIIMLTYGICITGYAVLLLRNGGKK